MWNETRFSLNRCNGRRNGTEPPQSGVSKYLIISGKRLHHWNFSSFDVDSSSVLLGAAN